MSRSRIPLRSAPCPDCGRIVGVQPEYNYSISELGVKPGVWRLSIHKREPGGLRCVGSRAMMDALMVTEREKSA